MDIKVMGPPPENSSAASVENYCIPMGMSEKEFEELAKKILVMVPHRPSEGISASITCAVGLWARHGVAFAPIEDQFAGHVDILRARMATTFLDQCRERPDLEYLVMIDSDEMVAPDAPYRLALWDLPIVSGVVCSFTENRNIWACFTVKDKYGVARFPSVRFTGKIPGQGLIPVHSVGGGLICIKKNVLEDIQKAGDRPFLISEEIRHEAIDTGNLKYGEDTWFCEQARRVGHICHVDFAVRALHIKPINLGWPAQLIDFNMDPREFKVDSREHHHG